MSFGLITVISQITFCVDFSCDDVVALHLNDQLVILDPVPGDAGHVVGVHVPHLQDQVAATRLKQPPHLLLPGQGLGGAILPLSRHVVAGAPTHRGDGPDECLVVW